MSFLKHPDGDEVLQKWRNVGRAHGVWEELVGEFTKEYLQKCLMYVASRRKEGPVYPENKDVFRAFRETPYPEVKVVILGQEPYYSLNTSDGLAFSSRRDLLYYDIRRAIPSLFLMLEYLDKSYPTAFPPKTEPDLTLWANQGVFLLNAVLTAEAGQAKTHNGIGWQKFTKEAVKAIDKKDNIVWILLGNDAQDYEELLQNDLCFVIKAEHPAYAARQNRPWLGEDCFRRCNDYLKSNSIELIDWHAFR